MPYCMMTSNRRYNIKEHITRKHPGIEIPDNLNSTNKTFTQSSLLSTTPSIFPAWLKYPNYFQNLPLPILDTNSRKGNRSNSLFKTILEFLAYTNLSKSIFITISRL